MPGQEGTETPARAWPPQPVPFDRFDAASINALTASLETVDCRSVCAVFEQAFAAARAQGQSDHMPVLQLLAGATSIVLWDWDWD
jgi:hypothetical protein